MLWVGSSRDLRTLTPPIIAPFITASNGQWFPCSVLMIANASAGSGADRLTKIAEISKLARKWEASMTVTEGALVAWAATARVLEKIEPAEVDLLPDIAVSAMYPSKRIGGVPGAFDFDLSSVQSVAAAVFPVVLVAIQFASPKLFEAAIEVGKDSAKKMLEARIGRRAGPTASPQIDMARLKEVIRTSVLERRLAPSTADAIANAVLAQLAVDKK